MGKIIYIGSSWKMFDLCLAANCIEPILKLKTHTHTWLLSEYEPHAKHKLWIQTKHLKIALVF